jgi:2-haloacid dehalogenase
MIKLILMDVDGTLIDFESAEKNAFRKTFDAAGFTGSLDQLKADYHAINQRLWSQLEEGTISSQEVRNRRFTELCRIYDLDWKADLLSETYLDFLGQEHELIEGAVEICQYLGEKYPVILVTNGFEDVQMNRIGATDLLDHVDHLVISETVGHNKPHPEIFRYALEIAGDFTPEETMIIGDSLTSDIQGGVNYGLKTCWFNPLGMDNSIGLVPDFEIDSLCKLKDIL